MTAYFLRWYSTGFLPSGKWFPTFPRLRTGQQLRNMWSRQQDIKKRCRDRENCDVKIVDFVETVMSKVGGSLIVKKSQVTVSRGYQCDVKDRFTSTQYLFAKFLWYVTNSHDNLFSIHSSRRSTVWLSSKKKTYERVNFKVLNNMTHVTEVFTLYLIN